MPYPEVDFFQGGVYIRDHAPSFLCTLSVGRFRFRGG